VQGYDTRHILVTKWAKKLSQIFIQFPTQGCLLESKETYKVATRAPHLQ
jgi:hypothetical protein